MHRLAAVLTLALSLFATQTQALPPLSMEGPLTARHFARPAAYQSVKMSPDGRILAVIAQMEGQSALLFLGLPDKNLFYGMRFQNGVVAGDVNWVSNERVLVSLAHQQEEGDAPAFTGELFGINANGSAQRYLFGGSRPSTIGTRLGGPEPDKGAAYFEAALPDAPDFALVRVLKNTVSTANGRYYDESFTPLSRINLNTGKRDEVAPSPVRTPQRYFADGKGRAFLVSGTSDSSYALQTFWRPGAGAWLPVPFKAVVLTPLRLSRDGTRAYFDAEYENGRECLLEWTLPAAATALSPPREVVCKPEPFLGTVYFDAADRPYGYHGGDATGVVLIDAKSADAQTLAALQEQFKGQLVYPAGASRAHDKLIYHVYSDRNSGEYYLFDAVKQDASYFDAAQTWIDPERMAVVKRIEYRARDGLLIKGYLTLPPGRGEQKLPMVVLPHGGPIGVQDQWGWDADAQFLASRGYAVLQMNYRGSSGRGEAFEKRGYGEWGGKIIDDITDGARWAVTSGVADAKRLCIVGTSYGGYAALMSAVREPELYRCAVGISGAYDLNLLVKDSDVSLRSSGRLAWQDQIGATPEVRARQSPVSYLPNLKAAVMIVHGEADIRTPFTQAKALRSALQSRKVEPEWLVKREEGHGFANEDNRTELYERLAAFLEKHIGR